MSDIVFSPESYRKAGSIIEEGTQFIKDQIDQGRIGTGSTGQNRQFPARGLAINHMEFPDATASWLREGSRAPSPAIRASSA